MWCSVLSKGRQLVKDATEALTEAFSSIRSSLGP